MAKAHGGLTIPASGGGTGSSNYPSLRYAGVSENEFLMMSLVDAMGLHVPEVRLVALDEIEGLPEGIDRFQEGAFGIRRFDRKDDGIRVHIENFAQVFDVYPEDKYRKAVTVRSPGFSGLRWGRSRSANSSRASSQHPYRQC